MKNVSAKVKIMILERQIDMHKRWADEARKTAVDHEKTILGYEKKIKQLKEWDEET